MSVSWVRRRATPLVVGGLAVLLTGLFFAGWDAISGQGGGHGWYVPGDLRGTVLAAGDYLHGHFGAVYSVDTGLVTLPGVLVLLGPSVLAAGIIHPGLAQAGEVFRVGGVGWLPIELVSMLSLPALLVAADALAERLGVARDRRTALAVFEGAASWGVVAWWGHPEDVLAVSLLLATVVALLDERAGAAGWLYGAAVAVQPVTLLAAGLLVARLRPGESRRFLGPACAVPAVLLAPVLAANLGGTLHTLSQQPNFPTVDHATPWGSWSLVAPGIGSHVLAAGPLRLGAVLLTVEGGLWLGRRHRFGPAALLWGLAGCLAVRVLLEPVMVAYYVWPALALALIGAAGATGRWRLWSAGLLAAFASIFGTVGWGADWAWWLVELACTGAILALAAPPRALAPPRQPPAHHQPARAEAPRRALSGGATR